MSTIDEILFEKQGLDAHNRFRAVHGCPPLQINKKLTKQARNWAQQLIDRNALQHNPNSDFGENLFMSQGLVKINGEVPVKAWYDEIKDYNFAAGKFSSDTGHFTQVIWRDTQEVGIAMAKRDMTVIVVANYKPPGNYVGRFKENVPPKQKITKPPEEELAAPSRYIERDRPPPDKKTEKEESAPASAKRSSKGESPNKSSPSKDKPDKTPATTAAPDQAPNDQNKWIGSETYARVYDMFADDQPTGLRLKNDISLKHNKERISFEYEVLEAINKIRVSHGMKPLKINKRLSQQAQDWAQVLADGNIHRNNQNVNVGQNIYKTQEPNLNGAKTVEEWYKEVDKNGFQVILKGTKELGVGLLKKGDTTLVVTFYNSSENKDKDSKEKKKDQQEASNKDEQKCGKLSKLCPCLR